MAKPTKLTPPSGMASDPLMRYLDFLEQWHATTKIMPTVFELAAAVDRSHSTTDIALNKLQVAGLVDRVRLAHRGIRITDKGRNALLAYRKKKARL